LVGVVVFDLVIIPRHEAWDCGVERLQIGIGAVKRVAVAVPDQIDGRRTVVLAQHLVCVRTHGGFFVDVIAEKNDEIRILGRQVPVGAEISVLPVRAGGECETHPRELGVWRWRSARKPDRTLFAQRREPIPVGPPRPQARDLDVHRMRPMFVRFCCAACNHAAHTRIGRHLPNHGCAFRHPAVAIRCQGIEREPRP
jgi:hypothetical protein